MSELSPSGCGDDFDNNPEKREFKIRPEVKDLLLLVDDYYVQARGSEEQKNSDLDGNVLPKTKGVFVATDSITIPGKYLELIMLFKSPVLPSLGVHEYHAMQNELREHLDESEHFVTLDPETGEEIELKLSYGFPERIRFLRVIDQESIKSIDNLDFDELDPLEQTYYIFMDRDKADYPDSYTVLDKFGLRPIEIIEAKDILTVRDVLADIPPATEDKGPELGFEDEDEPEERMWETELGYNYDYGQFITARYFEKN